MLIENYFYFLVLILMYFQLNLGLMQGKLKKLLKIFGQLL